MSSLHSVPIGCEYVLIWMRSRLLLLDGYKSENIQDVGMTVLKTIETRVLYADKGKDIWHDKQGAA